VWCSARGWILPKYVGYASYTLCELTRALELSQPKISRHLVHLRESSLLLSHRAGQWMYYRINPSLPDWTQSILQQTLAGNRDT